MNPYGKQKSRNSSLQRIYSFENGRNGGLGPGFFISKFIFNNNPINIIKKKIYDLSIYIIFSNSIPSNLLSLIQNNVYNLNIQKYLVNLSNINSIKTNIKSDESRRFLIVDSTTSQQFSDLNIPFYIYDSNNVNNKLSSIINSILFYKIEEKYKI
jgi:hypothetical protein